MENTPAMRAEKLLSQMSVEEKLYQLSSQMLFSVNEEYEQNRNHKYGNFRNPGHFMHAGKEEPVSAAEVTERINRDVRLSMDAHPHAIPPLEHGEALHGAQWGMATCFPQPIAMASMFDDEMAARIGDAIGKECAAVGVHQALAPVVNVSRDCRWGRTVETFGEDVLLSSNMGVAICRGLQNNGVIATPKHYADNYSYGGRDSNVSDTSERVMREVYLKPFEKCFREGGAMSVMAAYNSWDGIPCSCSKRLLTEILRDEWGFQGFVVSDYTGVEGVSGAHMLVDTDWKAEAFCLKAGLDVNLPDCSFDKLKTAYDEGWINEEDIDRAVLRVLTAKFSIGLIDNPFADPEAAEKIVRCESHKKLALESARQSIVLLKNEGVLPFKRTEMKTLAVFGAGADILPVGRNYSGPYGKEWTAEDAKTPLQILREYLDGYAEVIYAEDDRIEEIAGKCDAAIYMTTVIEGEGMDRSDIRLPAFVRKTQKDDNGMIVGKFAIEVRTDQEESIRRMTEANSNSAVVLLNGAPVDMSAWIDGCRAVLEAWYPGEQGGQAICDILFGEICPSAKLPITFPRSVGQLPLFYSAKPSGRGYGYVENDGSPLYPFGYGLSYTTFVLAPCSCRCCEEHLEISLTVENIGQYDGAEVVQIYLSGKNCDVVMPRMELKAYKRVFAGRGEKTEVIIEVPAEAFMYYDREMAYGMHDGDYTVSVGISCVDIKNSFAVKVRDGKIMLFD
ncbi:MAG: glycoside hydrolase family 3 C-terminal domain-containing protein [Clostridia bacterium]|nr:glycoside hydrolase family 3 C-terminal domain-containing protein [Clostridia bacterium]